MKDIEPRTKRDKKDPMKSVFDNMKVSSLLKKLSLQRSTLHCLFVSIVVFVSCTAGLTQSP